jgi:hypothetical protein
MVSYDRLTIIYSLPRSRSQWFTWLFRHACEAWHDGMRGCSSPRAFRDKVLIYLRENEHKRLVIADTGAILFYDELERLMPGHRKAFVIREVQDVIRSLHRQGVTGLDDMMRRQANMLARHSGGHFVFHFNSITVHELARLWRTVTGEYHRPLPFFEKANKVYVDTPIKDQPQAPRAARSLIRFADKR